MCVKISAIYYGLFNGTAKEFRDNVKEDIQLRNDYILDNIKPTITAYDYQNLFDSVIELLTVFD